jgi:hypothetical protein
MNKMLALAFAGSLALPVPLAAQEVINLTIASSHPTTIPWVGMMQTHFQARTDEILAETGNYRIEWQEAYGGQLYRANATLNSVEDGITDVGWVFSMLEGGQLPLSQVSSYTPFSTNNPPAQLAVMWDLIQNNPDFAEEWSQYNLVVLGVTGTDNYDIYTAEPIASIADLDGMKISAPGAWPTGCAARVPTPSMARSPATTPTSRPACPRASCRWRSAFCRPASTRSRPTSRGCRWARPSPAPSRSTRTAGTRSPKRFRPPCARPVNTTPRPMRRTCWTGTSSR